MATLERTSLILGGARSGKTARALALASVAPARVYIATAQAFDSEMAERIRRHKAERDESWRTIEAPIDIANAIQTEADTGTAVVVDCLTLWLSNLLHTERDPERETEALLSSLNRSQARIILVSNEVGLGIVPENALARRFRDAQGRLNQRIAGVAAHVEFIAAGLPLVLKSPGTPTV